jgi:PAS domain S-box-containing protein
LQERGLLARCAIAIAAVFAAFLLRSLVAPWLGRETPFAFLLPAVFVAAAYGGARGGICATVAGALVGALTIDPPLSWMHPGDMTRLTLFVTNGGIITGLCAVLRRLARKSRADTDQAARNMEIMANTAPVLMWLSDAKGQCVFVNRNWATFTGRPTGTAGRRPGQLHPADLARYQAVAAEATAARRPFRIEYRLRRADGTYRWISEHAVPRFGSSGAFEGYIGSGTDVTDSRNEREELAFIARVQTALTESLDLDRCTDVLVQSFLPRMADWCSILLMNDAGRLERIRVQHFEVPASVACATGGRFEPSEPDALAGRVVQTGESQLVRGRDPLLLAALAHDEAHRERLEALENLSYLAVPLRVRGHIVGVLALATAESGRTLQDEDRRLVQRIAAIAGFALDNARLYRSTRHALAAEEHALREMERSERRFRFIWEANIFGMCTVARSGRILTANAALADLLGYSGTDIAEGRASIHERTAPAWRAADQRANDELQQTGRCAPFEKEYLRPDGSSVQVLVCGSLLPNSDECMAFVLDLTARKHAERALDRQRLLLKTIIDAMPAAVGYLGPDERFWLCNQKYEKWLGGGGPVNGRTMAELLGPAAYDRVAPYLRAAFRGRNMRHETSLVAQDRERHLIASYRPDRDPEGRVCGIVVHAYDITERKETEQALADALTRYRFLADAMPQMVWTALPDGQLDYVNRRWLETTGMTEAASLAPDGWLEAVHFEDREATRQHWRQAVADCAPFEHECRLRCGRNVSWRWHLVRALPRRDDHLTLVQWVGSATDMDEQRRAYAELAEARARLKSHADDLEARVRARTATLREANAELEAFTYSVSHDLRTPLQFVRGFAEAIRTDAGDSLSADNRDYLQRIIRAATRMDAIIQDLLAYSRLSRSEMQLAELPLEEVVADVLANHHAMIRQTGATVTVDRPLPTVSADKTGLYQALSNLVSNALKFSRPGEAPRVRIRAESANGATRLWIEDHGIGIDPRHHERIFQLFERLHSPAEYPGTGIGLSLVRKAVQRMGGRCGLESAPQLGSRFWIDFPQVCPVARAEPAVAEAPPA